MPVFVGHIRSIAVKDPERPAEVPHRPAPAGLLPEFKPITHPGEHNSMRRMLESAPLTDVHSHSLLLEFLPRPDQRAAQTLLVPKVSFLELQGPCRHGPLIRT